MTFLHHFHLYNTLLEFGVLLPTHPVYLAYR
nr:unnamed protein product [Callosobruchus analis]